jgi:hypothetical protein
MKAVSMMVTFKAKANISLQKKVISMKEISKITTSQAKAKCNLQMILLILVCLKMVCLMVKVFNIKKEVTTMMDYGETM